MKITEVPALKMFFLLVGVSLVFFYLDLNNTFLIALGFISFAAGCLLIYFKYLRSAYFLWIAAAGILLSQSFDLNKNRFPDKIIPSEKAVFNGYVTNLVKVNEKFVRYFAKGDLNSVHMPVVKNTKIILTVFYPKFVLKPGDYFTSAVTLKFPEAQMPGERFNTESYYRTNEISWEATSTGNSLFLKDDKNIFYSFSYSMRDNLKRRIYSLFEEYTASIITALLTGDKTEIKSETKQNFSFAGTAHILSVSGLHVGIIYLIIFTFLSFVQSRFVKTIFTISFLYLFVYLTGGLESAFRASLMISVYLIAANIEQKMNPINSLAIAALIMFCINPDVIFSISFILSVLSVGGILIFFIKIKEILSFYKNSFYLTLISSFSITLSASIFISPIIAYLFGVFSIISPIANFFVVPIMMLALCYGLAALILSYFSNIAADFFTSAAEFMVFAADKINNFSVSFQFSYIDGQSSIYVAAAVSLAVIYILYSKSSRIRFFRIGASVAAILLISYLAPFSKESEITIIPKENLTAVVLNNNFDKYLILFDKETKNSQGNDISIKNFILNNPNIKVCINGSKGHDLVYKLKKEHNFQFKVLNKFSEKRILTLLNFHNHPAKIIDI